MVLDIEVSFASMDEDKKQDRIDILLFNKRKQSLQFVEAKHYSNKEIWSTGTPKVIKQINRYNFQITKQRDDILKAYTEYINVINNLFNLSLPKSTTLENKTILLIFGFDNDHYQIRK